MTNLADISQAIHLVMREDPRKSILDQQRLEDKQKLREIIGFWGKRNVQNWLDDTAEEE